MQGSFEIEAADEPDNKRPKMLGAKTGTRWTEVLDPGVDETTENAYSEEVANARAAHRHADIERPSPADPSFTHKFLRVYILTDALHENFPLRIGKLGHFIRPHRPRAQGSNFNAPYPLPERSPHQLVVRRGAPGFPMDGERDDRRRPHPFFSVDGRDYVRPDGRDHVRPDSTYLEIGIKKLKSILEEAESLDLSFAKRMEGLQNVASSVVWDCIDPDFNPTDRQAVLNQFMGKYLDRFYSKLDPVGEPGVRDVASEALHKHKAFCEEWVKKHYKNLTPLITSSAEALAGDFYPHFEKMMTPDKKITRTELARILMRHEEFACLFASALYHHITNLDHTRGGRNASITQTRNSMSLLAWEYKKLGTAISENSKIIWDVISARQGSQFAPIEKYTVDWYDILGQMPQIHRYFDDMAHMNMFTPGRVVNRRGQQQVPPWRFAMDDG